MLSDKPIATRDRLIFAMDVPDADAARQLAEQLGDSVQFYKLGLELFMAGGYFELLDWLVGAARRCSSISSSSTCRRRSRRAVSSCAIRGVTFATVHGNQSIMEAAAAAQGDVKILAVTVLTSLDRGDLDDLGFGCDVEELVLSRARRALEAGCDGVVSSGLEAAMLRQHLDRRLLVVTPGIRPVENRPADDQEARGGRRAGVRQRRRLHRGRAADPRCRRPARRCRGHPATIAGVFDNDK